jgi:hypothetical protein
MKCARCEKEATVWVKVKRTQDDHTGKAEWEETLKLCEGCADAKDN